MQDKYTGQAGTFYTDPKTGKRLNQAEWDAQQQAQAAKAPTTKIVTKQEKTDAISAT